MLLNISLNEYFHNKIKNLKCREDTGAYLVSTFDKYKNYTYNFNKSFTLEFAEAKFALSFEKYQNLADCIFMLETLYPQALQGASKEYYFSLAQNSYYKLYMITKTWVLFEELADKMPELVEQLQKEFTL